MNPIKRVIVTIQVQSNGGFNNWVLILIFFDAKKKPKFENYKKLIKSNTRSYTHPPIYICRDLGGNKTVGIPSGVFNDNNKLTES